MKSAGVLLPLIGLLACSAPIDTPEQDFKEVYVEAQHDSSVGVALRDFPLEPEAEERSYVVVRSFAMGREEGRRKLGRMIGQWPPPRKEKEASEKPQPSPKEGKAEPTEPGGSGAPEVPEEDEEPEEIELDLDDLPEKDPSLLMFPEKVELRGEGACYLGHSAYRHEPSSRSPGLIHHMRLLVVNRQAVAVLVRLEDMTLESGAASSADAEEGAVASDLEMLVAADRDGHALSVLFVPPNEQRVAHVFFRGRTLPNRLVVSWSVDRGGKPPANPRMKRRWDFTATLVRRYLIPDGILTPLERQVKEGVTLTPARPDPRIYTEPLVSPIAPASR